MNQPAPAIRDDSRRERVRHPSVGALRALGPGLVTGAADDDPSGIATYSQVGAQFGYGIAWTMVVSLPLMFVIQLLCARIGAVTGHGVAENLRRHYPRWALRAAVLLLLVANIINLGADLGAMGAAVKLIVGGPELLYTVLLGVVSVGLQIAIPYSRYALVLNWLTLSLLAYVGVVFVAQVNWRAMLGQLVWPHIVLDKAHSVALVSVLGTTISPYLFFWQAGQEVEEGRRQHARPLKFAAARAESELARMRLDTGVGMFVSNLIAIFIITATAATLNAHGITRIDTSAQAAEALRPIAGPFAFLLFAAGIIGTGLLAVPVLAGSAAYAVAETAGWPCSLERRPREAKAFYGVIAAATLAGLALNFVGIDPIKALFYAAAVNGALSAPLMALILMIAANPRDGAADRTARLARGGLAGDGGDGGVDGGVRYRLTRGRWNAGPRAVFKGQPFRSAPWHATIPTTAAPTRRSRSRNCAAGSPM